MFETNTACGHCGEFGKIGYVWGCAWGIDYGMQLAYGNLV